MREEGLFALGRRRRRPWSSYEGERSPAPPNLPLLPDGTHRFRAGRPNELWVTDITEFRLPSGARCHLSPVIDCLNGRPVAWPVSPGPDAALANSSPGACRARVTAATTRAEGFFGLLKCEFFHGRDWRGWGLGDFMAELDGWMSWYREGRASQALRWLTPDEHRVALGYPVWVCRKTSAVPGRFLFHLETRSRLPEMQLRRRGNALR